jgi:hypothetical protein
VGVGNPIAVPCMARLVARGVKSGGCDSRIITCSEASVRWAFKKSICTPSLRSPVRLVRYFFSVQDTPQSLSCLWVGLVADADLGNEEGTGGSELAAGVGASDGQPGNNAKARRSLGVD